MQNHEPTPEEVNEWRQIFKKYRGFLTPNRRTGRELDEYLRAHYDMKRVYSDELSEIVAGGVTDNEHDREKLPEGMEPEPVTYLLDDGKIFVGIDLTTGAFHVEGSEELYNELFVYLGLDEKDLENCFLVAEYVKLTGLLKE